MAMPWMSCLHRMAGALLPQRLLVLCASTTAAMAACCLNSHKARRACSRLRSAQMANAWPAPMMRGRVFGMQQPASNCSPSRGHGKGVRTSGIAFSPDGKWVASTGNDAAVQVWDAETGKVIFNADGPYRPHLWGRL